MTSLFLNSCKVEIFSEISEGVFLNYIHNFCLDFQIEKSQIRGKMEVYQIVFITKGRL